MWSVPITVPAPGRFSTTTGWSHLSESCRAIARANASAELPVSNGKMNRTGRVGQSGGGAANAAMPSAASKASRKYRAARIGLAGRAARGDLEIVRERWGRRARYLGGVVPPAHAHRILGMRLGQERGDLLAREHAALQREAALGVLGQMLVVLGLERAERA